MTITIMTITIIIETR